MLPRIKLFKFFSWYFNCFTAIFTSTQYSILKCDSMNPQRKSSIQFRFEIQKVWEIFAIIFFYPKKFIWYEFPQNYSNIWHKIFIYLKKVASFTNFLFEKIFTQFFVDFVLLFTFLFLCSLSFYLNFLQSLGARNLPCWLLDSYRLLFTKHQKQLILYSFWSFAASFEQIELNIKAFTNTYAVALLF